MHQPYTIKYLQTPDTTSNQWSATPDSKKIAQNRETWKGKIGKKEEKSGKKEEKSGRNGKNQEISFTLPSWQIGQATLLHEMLGNKTGNELNEGVAIVPANHIEFSV